MSTSNQRVNPAFQGTHKQILVFSTILINLCVISLAYFFLNNSYDQFQHLTETRTKDLSLVLTHTISGIIDKIDLNLLSISDKIEEQLPMNKIENLPLDSILTLYAKRTQEIHRLIVLNAQGELVSGHKELNLYNKNFAYRDYFVRLRDNTNKNIFISKPILGVVGGKWVQVFARRINNPDGSFAGVVAGSVNIELFLNLFSSLSIGEHGSITLRDKELAIVARYPQSIEVGSTVGQKTISKEFRELIESGKTSMTYKATYPVDHIERIYTYNKISDYPLYINVGMATSDVLKTWHHQVIYISGLVSIFFMVTVLLNWILNRKWKEEHQSAVKMTALSKILHRTGKLAQVGGWEINPATMELYWSEQVYLIHEVNQDTNITVKDAIRFYKPEAQKIIMEAVKQLMEHGTPFDLELEIITAKNHPLWVRSQSEAEWFENKIVKIYGTFQDVTIRKLSELQLKKKSEEIEQFLYTVSHDLRSPLVTIKTFMGYLEMDMTEGKQEHLNQDIKYIHGAADKMKLLLDGLLEMSRIDRTESPPVRVSFKDVVADALNSLAGVISERKVDIHICDTELMFFGDRLRLYQLWVNLIENAIKYTSEESIPLIELGVQQENRETVFFVKDNGLGIDPQYQNKIFGIFEKIDQKSSGVGLGLSMVKRIVENNGGRIWVESEDKGSCFFFTLPNVVIQN